MKKLIIIGAGVAFAASAMAGPISLTGAAHTENFDTLMSSGGTGGGSIPIDAEIVNATFWGSTPSGWWNGAGTSYGTATSGLNGNSSRLLSYGADGVAERALGLGWRDGGLAIGAQFQNTTGAAITQLDVVFDGELWYTGPAAMIGAPGTLIFEYSTDATSLLDAGATWNAVTGLNFDAPSAGKSQFTAYDGNLAANRVAGISDSITGLSIADNSTFFIRWSNSASHGAGIDNFSIQAVPEPATLGLLGLAGAALYVRRRFMV